MDTAHLSYLQNDYDLGKIHSIAESFEGVVNHNYIIYASSGKYLLKQFRYKTLDALPEIAMAETLMRERGIPAICMIPSRSGASFVVHDDAPYALYPFIESDRRHTYSLDDYHRIGAMLGRIHLAGSKDIPDALLQRTFPDAVITRDSAEQFAQPMRKYIKIIKHKPEREEVDEEFLRYMELKLSLIPRVDFDTILPRDTLIHGDYHMRNLFIDAQTREIIGICDWEHTNFWSRAYELARSYLYICFPEHYDATAFPIAERFMQGYQSVYPISHDEMASALRVRLRDIVSKTWLEKKHYKHNDTRSDHLIGHEMRLIKDFVVGTTLEKLAL